MGSMAKGLRKMDPRAKGDFSGNKDSNRPRLPEKEGHIIREGQFHIAQGPEICRAMSVPINGEALLVTKRVIEESRRFNHSLEYPAEFFLPTGWLGPSINRFKLKASTRGSRETSRL